MNFQVRIGRLNQAHFTGLNSPFAEHRERRPFDGAFRIVDEEMNHVGDGGGPP